MLFPALDSKHADAFIQCTDVFGAKQTKQHACRNLKTLTDVKKN